MSLSKALGLNLIYCLAVIVFGALVRATGSGAGCGSDWPLCNGSFIASAQFSTIIEYTHRLMSGVLLITIIVALIFSYIRFAKHHPARILSVLVLVFVVIEALIGAGLVLLKLVGDNQSYLRSFVMGGHLINTFFLLALQFLHYYVSKFPKIECSPIKLFNHVFSDKLWMISIFFVLITCATGAMVALGDTLFINEHLEHTFNSAYNFLIKLRIYHPLLAIFTLLLVMSFCVSIVSGVNSSVDDSNGSNQYDHQTKLGGYVLLSLVIIQLMVGVLNWWLMVPVFIQLIHLLLACLLWLALWYVALATFKVEDKDKVVSGN